MNCWCGQPLIRSHDEAGCLHHGTIVSPPRASDIGPQTPRNQSGRPARPYISVHISPRERAALEAAERGDPDALDEHEWDAALEDRAFSVRPTCKRCGKRAVTQGGCLSCKEVAS